ncbi:hypothetical protein N3K66_001157 [Trichothecium roseum]|uniref:Uncharacterized protein n=1 Tax=Trichothecium roseum TaxID=47278 RepID=A0ACC0VGP0_9HYPO|nr:hypothetical protein N3K66_001157 [Trichothecium roseum]
MATPAAASPPPPQPSPEATPQTSSPYPFATAPDVIRSHQKDAYFTGHLANTLTDLHRRLLGARSAHASGPELRAAASLLYFGLTTLPGNRTLGEEYCDLVQVESGGGRGGRLPSLPRRAAYVVGSILVPYLAGRALPRLRTRLRALLDRRLATLRAENSSSNDEGGKDRTATRQYRLLQYLSANLSQLTSASPWHAATLAAFYFSGTYYELAKRLLSLRYVFSREVPDTPDRAGYELLGVLLAVQLAVQAYLHVRSTLLSSSGGSSSAQREERAGFRGGTVDVSLSHDNSYSDNNTLLMSGGAGAGAGGGSSSQDSKLNLSAATHTPPTAGNTPRFDLSDAKLMGYIRGDQQRKCTLCLEELKDPAATQCGHVFCWECIGDWVREKPECPLCRRDALAQHILPLRVM